MEMIKCQKCGKEIQKLGLRKYCISCRKIVDDELRKKYCEQAKIDKKKKGGNK